MKVLVMMLFNIKMEAYHPIMYFESPLPGGDSPVLRYKSKGHRTTGFLDKEEAITSIKTEIVGRLEGYTITQELEPCIEWTGEGVPTDIQLRAV